MDSQLLISRSSSCGLLAFKEIAWDPLAQPIRQAACFPASSAFWCRRKRCRGNMNNQSAPGRSGSFEDKEFDYIIVGAGSAGCVLANRLTASGKNRVLLLVAGGHDRHIWVSLPLGYGKLFTVPNVYWIYTSEP